MSIAIRQISKNFGSFSALTDINLDIRSGELVALLGPSGSGKTTLLRIIAGLEAPDSGSIILHNEEATKQSVRSRQVGFVFQHYALFRHMSVFENIAFGLRIRPRRTRPSNVEIKRRVDELLKLVQLDQLGNRYPSQLSGGQRQRVALARALAIEPKVLLLDEPFGALDAQVRQELRRWLRRLHDELHITSVFVTHDQEEALEVADTVVVMNKGNIEQIGTPSEVYDHPANPFVYNFLGRVNLFHGRANDNEVMLGGLALEISGSNSALRDAPVVAYARPHDLQIERKNGKPASASMEAIIRHINSIGPVVRLELERGDTGDMISAEITRERYSAEAWKVGESVNVKPQNVRIFRSDEEIQGNSARDTTSVGPSDRIEKEGDPAGSKIRRMPPTQLACSCFHWPPVRVECSTRFWRASAVNLLFLLKGLLIGLSIAAPVGPIGALCIRRTIADGRIVGLACGMGAATADGFYGAVAAFGLTAVSQFLLHGKAALSLIGGVFLCYLGVRTLLAKPSPAFNAPVSSVTVVGAYATTLALTIGNPMTILSFIAVFAGLGVGAATSSFADAALVVAGVFLGSALWWLCLSWAVSRLTRRLDTSHMAWVNWISGLGLLAFGVGVLAQQILTSR